MTQELFSTTPRRGSGDPPSLRGSVAEAVRYWERRRLWYNAAFALLAAGWMMMLWLDFRPRFNLDAAGNLIRFALLANICYCAAYVVDIPLSRSDFKAAWQQRRGMLWIAGTVFAILLTFYWIADQISPYVR